MSKSKVLVPRVNESYADDVAKYKINTDKVNSAVIKKKIETARFRDGQCPTCGQTMKVFTGLFGRPK